MERKSLQLNKNKKAYFAGDFHLGKPGLSSSIEREKKIILWLKKIENDAQELFFMGDVFDFWFEYKNVIPKSNLKFLSKISDLIDKGINIHYFKGNHDLWTIDFFEKMGMKVYNKPTAFKLNNKLIYVGHGDGIGKGDFGYKLLKKIFTNRVCKKLFRIIHPDVGIKIGKFFSRTHQKNKNDSKTKLNNKRIVDYCKDFNTKNHNDAYIFGHSHFISEISISKNSKYYNCGDWMSNSNYLEFEKNTFKLKEFY